MVGDVREEFIQHGLRCTRQRMAIYEVLQQTTSHPTAEELYELVRDDCDGLSLATVYNTLEALCDAGLCRRLPVMSGSTRYDAHLDPHLHVIDASTGRYIDVPDELGEELLASLRTDVVSRIEEQLGVHIDRVSLQLISGVNGNSNGGVSATEAPNRERESRSTHVT